MREMIQRAWDEVVYLATGVRPWLTREARANSEVLKREAAKPEVRQAAQEYMRCERQPTGGLYASHTSQARQPVRARETARDDGRDR